MSKKRLFPPQLDPFPYKSCQRWIHDGTFGASNIKTYLYHISRKYIGIGGVGTGQCSLIEKSNTLLMQSGYNNLGELIYNTNNNISNGYLFLDP